MNKPTKMLWLHIAAEGRCTAGELKQNFPQIQFISKYMSDMKRDGLLERFELPGEKKHHESRYAYGVTAHCKMPNGLTVAEVMEAVSGKAQ